MCAHVGRVQHLRQCTTTAPSTTRRHGAGQPRATRCHGTGQPRATRCHGTGQPFATHRDSSSTALVASLFIAHGFGCGRCAVSSAFGRMSFAGKAPPANATGLAGVAPSPQRARSWPFGFSSLAQPPSSASLWFRVVPFRLPRPP